MEDRKSDWKCSTVQVSNSPTWTYWLLDTKKQGVYEISFVRMWKTGRAIGSVQQSKCQTVQVSNSPTWTFWLLDTKKTGGIWDIFEILLEYGRQEERSEVFNSPSVQQSNLDILTVGHQKNRGYMRYLLLKYGRQEERLRVSNSPSVKQSNLDILTVGHQKTGGIWDIFEIHC